MKSYQISSKKNGNTLTTTSDDECTILLPSTGKLRPNISKSQAINPTMNQYDLYLDGYPLTLSKRYFNSLHSMHGYQ